MRPVTSAVVANDPEPSKAEQSRAEPVPSCTSKEAFSFSFDWWRNGVGQLVRLFVCSLHLVPRCLGAAEQNRAEPDGIKRVMI